VNHRPTTRTDACPSALQSHFPPTAPMKQLESRFRMFPCKQQPGLVSRTHAFLFHVRPCSRVCGSSSHPPRALFFSLPLPRYPPTHGPWNLFLSAQPTRTAWLAAQTLRRVTGLMTRCLVRGLGQQLRCRSAVVVGWSRGTASPERA